VTAATTLATRILRLQQRAVAIEVRGFTLEVIAGPDTGKLHKAKQRSVLIGTHPSADVVLSDPHVSRLHARLDVEDDEYVLRDLGSTNGTRVSEVKIREACLAEGALVEVGTSRLRFRFSGEPFEIPLADEEGFEGLIGRSVAMRELFQMCARVAPSEATVLIEGETGSGKELVAEALHRRSRRKDKPFVIFDCGAAPATLIESELFGHERGAFTGAVAARAGVFERADGGTLFLDELGELALELQPKLLRALEAGEIQRVGGEKVKKVDVRVIAATHRDLARLIAEGSFRADLFYRLAVIRLRVPALRERREDIPLLAASFARAALEGANLPAQALEVVFEKYRSHAWPGNVRELRNAVERAVVLADPKLVGASDALAAAQVLSRSVDGSLGRRRSLRDARDEHDRDYLVEILRAAEGDITAAAAIAEVHPKSLERLIRKYRLGKSG
jgi:two-component system response regulator GlrR